MTTLGAAIYRELGGASGRFDEVDDLTDAIDWQMRHADHNVSKAARELGVPRTTLRRWLAGAEPSFDRAETITGRAKGNQRKALFPGGIGALRVIATFTYDAGGAMSGAENRDIALGDYLDDWVEDALIDAYLEGADADELGELLASGINDPTGWYAATFQGAQGGEWDIHSIEGWRT